MNKGELIAALANKTEMTKESSCPRCPQPPHRRFCEDRCLQGSCFQGRQSSEGRCQQVIRFLVPAAARLRDFSLRKRSKKLQKHNICAKLTAQVLLYGFIQGRNSYDR